MKKSLKVFTSLLVLSQLNSCYLLSQGSALLKYNFSARPLTEVYQDPNINEKIKERIKLVYEIRSFAIEKLKLKENKNYTSYVEMNNQDYLVNVVVASKPDKLEAYQWSFPFFGSFPYKGFYQLDEARVEAKKLAAAGYDVHIRKAGAFSTLGWFADPIYSFMLNYSTEYLANLIIHEMVHATVFIKDNIQFNEELANFIGDYGAVEFLRYKYGENSEEYRQSFGLKEDSKTFSRYINQFHDALEQVYQNGDLNKWQKKRLKKKVISEYQGEHFKEVSKQFKVKGSYGWFPKMEMNNAVIMSFITYERDYSLYEKLYHQQDKSLPGMIDVFKTIEKERPDNPKQFLKDYLEKKI